MQIAVLPDKYLTTFLENPFLLFHDLDGFQCSLRFNEIFARVLVVTLAERLCMGLNLW